MQVSSDLSQLSEGERAALERVYKEMLRSVRIQFEAYPCLVSLGLLGGRFGKRLRRLGLSVIDVIHECPGLVVFMTERGGYKVGPIDLIGELIRDWDTAGRMNFCKSSGVSWMRADEAFSAVDRYLAVSKSSTNPVEAREMIEKSAAPSGN